MVRMSKRVGLRLAAVFMLLALVLPGVGAASAAGPGATGGAKSQVAAKKQVAKKHVAKKSGIRTRVAAALKKGVKPATILKQYRAHLAKLVKAGKMTNAAAKARYAKVVARAKAYAKKHAAKKSAA